jgi:hypothetical protein
MYHLECCTSMNYAHTVKLLLSILIFLVIEAKSAEILPCDSAIKATLKKWEVVGPWGPVLTSDPSKKTMRSPGKKIGVWSETTKLSDVATEAKLITAKDFITVTWTKPGCSPSLKYSVRPISEISLRETQDLKGRIESLKSGVVYLWSPHMEASIYGLKEIMAATSKLKVPLLPILHPDANIEDARRVAKDIGLPLEQVWSNKSNDLYMRGLNLHAPSLSVFKSSRWAGPLLLGAEGRESYEKFILKVLENSP